MNGNSYKRERKREPLLMLRFLMHKFKKKKIDSTWIKDIKRGNLHDLRLQMEHCLEWKKRNALD